MGEFGGEAVMSCIFPFDPCFRISIMSTCLETEPFLQI